MLSLAAGDSTNAVLGYHPAYEVLGVTVRDGITVAHVASRLGVEQTFAFLAARISE